MVTDANVVRLTDVFDEFIVIPVLSVKLPWKDTAFTPVFQEGEFVTAEKSISFPR